MHFIFNQPERHTFCTFKKVLLRIAVIFIYFLSAEKAISQSREFYNLYFAGNAAYSKGEYDKAIAKYNEALKQFQADYVYCSRANAHFGKKDYKAALLDYDKTLKLNDEYAEAYYQRGLTHQILGDKQKSCDDFKKADKLKLKDGGTAFKKYCK